MRHAQLVTHAAQCFGGKLPTGSTVIDLHRPLPRRCIPVEAILHPETRQPVLSPIPTSAQDLALARDRVGIDYIVAIGVRWH